MKRPGPKALIAYEVYESLGPGRTLAAAAEAMGRPPSYEGQLKKWSAAFDWVNRAGQADALAIREGLADQAAIRDQVRVGVSDLADEALQVAAEILRDKSTLPILDRHGRVVGQRRAVSAATRLQASQWLLATIGVAPVKRLGLEISASEDLSARADRVLDMASLEECDRLKIMLDEIEARGAAAPSEPPVQEPQCPPPLH